MNFRIQTRYDEMCLCVKISCSIPTKVRIKIYDEEKPKIVFTDRYKTVNNSETFLYYGKRHVKDLLQHHFCSPFGLLRGPIVGTRHSKTFVARTRQKNRDRDDVFKRQSL